MSIRAVGGIDESRAAWKSLGEVGTFVRGNGLQKSDLSTKGTPAIHYGQIHTHYGIWAAESKSFVSPELAAKLRVANPGDLIVATTSEDDAAVGKAVAWLGAAPVAVSGDAYIYRHCLDPKYISYFFASRGFQDQKRRFLSGTKVRRIAGEALSRIRVPVPPLEVQREIVRILDQFTQLEAELEAELECRREMSAAFASAHFGRLYARHRSETSAEWQPLRSVMRRFSDAVAVQAGEEYESLGVRWYGQGAFSRGTQDGSRIKGLTLFKVKPGLFVYNRMFVVEGSFAIIPAELAGGVVSSEFPLYEVDTSRVNPRWLVAYLLDEFTLKRIEAEVTGVERGSMKSRRRWREHQLEAFAFPQLDRSEQDAFVDSLDTLRDLERSLERELMLRRRQYEYYRDRLLAFEALPA